MPVHWAGRLAPGWLGQEMEPGNHVGGGRVCVCMCLYMCACIVKKSIHCHAPKVLFIGPHSK